MVVVSSSLALISGSTAVLGRRAHRVCSGSRSTVEPGIRAATTTPMRR